MFRWKKEEIEDQGVKEREIEEQGGKIEKDVAGTMVKSDISSSFGNRFKMFEEFRNAKSKILSPEDFAEVVLKDRKTGEMKKRKIILKSGWRKIKLFFGISSEILDIKRERDGNKIIYMCKARVYTQGGISAEAVGICSSDEPGKANMSEYILSSIAQTRAINKAIADLVGVDSDEEEETHEIEDEVYYDKDKRYNEKQKEEIGIMEADHIDKSALISKIFDLMKDIKLQKSEIFSMIKKELGFDKRAQVKITDLSINQLKKIERLMSSLLSEGVAGEAQTKEKHGKGDIVSKKIGSFSESGEDETFF